MPRSKHESAPVGQVEVRTFVVVPRPPNFLRDASTQAAVDVAGFSEEELRVIGEAWTHELIRNAQKRRAEQVRGADA